MAIFRKESPGLPSVVRPQGDVGVILVDMQEHFVNKLRPQTRARIVTSQIQLLQHCASTETPLFVLEYRGYGNTITKLQREIKKVPHTQTITKHYNDGFYNTPLREELEKLAIKSLVLMGINASFCVWDTALAGKQQGFAIRTAEDLIGDCTCHEKPAAVIFERYRSNGMVVHSSSSLINLRP